MASVSISLTIALLTFLSTLTLLASPALGHGQMCEPRQRGAYTTSSNRCLYNKDPSTLGGAVMNPVQVDYCPHCLNGFGTKNQNVPVGGWVLYDPINNIETARQAGLCGNAVGNDDHMLGGRYVPERYENVPIVNVSQTGGTIDFSAQLDTNHNGYFEFYLCDLDACGTSDIAEKCFSEGHCYRLDRVPHPVCEDLASNTQEFCLPVDPAYPARWYIPCRKQSYTFGGPSGIMRYKLPEGVTCRHCVVQWYWATANSCNPRGQREFIEGQLSDIENLCDALGGEDVALATGPGECSNGKIPEEFWSCGDIQISADGNSLGPVPMGSVALPPSQSATPVAVPVPESSTPTPSPTKSMVVGVDTPIPTMSASPSASMMVAPTVTPSVAPSMSVSPSPAGGDGCLAEGEVYAADGTECCSGEHGCRLASGGSRFRGRKIVCYCK